MSRRKFKIQSPGKKAQFSTEYGGLWLENSTNLHFQSGLNLTFFSRAQILIFLCQATQGDHIRLLNYFEQCTHFFGCVGSCGYVPPSVKYH